MLKLAFRLGSTCCEEKGSCEDMYKSIDESVDNIEKQVKRYKGKLRTIKHRAKDEERIIKATHAVFEASPDN